MSRVKVFVKLDSSMDNGEIRSDIPVLFVKYLGEKEKFNPWFLEPLFFVF